jgi:acyl-CoA synthetase (AMP-forming)/AMP-acid ligase II/thioesterase domain-containing protein
MTDIRPSAIAELLRQQASARPDAPAAWDGRRTLAMAELDALAGTLAARLLEALPPAGPGRPILPIIGRYGVESVVAVHAAVRAGQAHSVLESSTPAAMIAEILTRMGRPPVVVITSSEQAALLPDGVRPLLVPDEPEDDVEPQPVAGDDLAFVIFTSGSTGRPKGVMWPWDELPRRNVELLIDPDDPDPAPVMQVSPTSFVAGYLRTLVPALGSPVSIINPVGLDPVALLERVDRERIRVVLAVPSLANSVVGRWAPGRRLEHVRELHVGGETVEWEYVPGLRTLLRDDAIIANRYGSSEVAGALRFDVPSDMPVGTGPVPLGRPVLSARVWLEPVDPTQPDGPREILIGGTSVSLGYLGDPELTAARFGRDESGGRYWRSGDIARYDEQGLVHRIGRVDDMVKIRGKLVEPSEPQGALRAMPGVRNAIVLPHAGAEGAVRLVGHVELEEGAALTAAQVRSHVATRVAPHLVPHLLVRHDRIPVNERGKTDRSALLSQPLVPWRTATPRPVANEEERFACSAAGRVLDLADVQPDDDLWELGLDSLSAVELTVILEDAGWRSLEPAMLLDHRSPAALARLATRSIRPTQAVWLNRDGTRPPVFCIPGAGGTSMAFRWVATALGPDQPMLVVEPRGLHSPGRPDRTVQAAATSAMAHIEPHLGDRPVVLVGYSGGGVVAFEIAHRLRERGTPTRVLLLDAAAGGTTMPPQPWPGLVRASKRAAMRTWLRVFPASTVPREQRYRAFYHLGGAAARRYELPTDQIPVTLIHPRGSALAAQWRARVREVTTIEVGGDHYSMLEPPHASDVARSIRQLIDA